MAETKDQIAAERDALRAENAQLRAQLGGQGRVVNPAHTFSLSEGDRQELVARGAVNIGGRLMSRDDVRERLGDDQQEVDLGDGPVDPGLAQVIERQRTQGATPGVDFVYPSVAPGEIDPAVAGTPGINGPAASTGTVEPTETPIAEQE